MTTESDHSPADPASRPPDLTLTPASGVHEALAARVLQQAAVAALGVRALGNLDLPALMQDAVETVSRTLDNEMVKVLELLPDRSAVRLVAGVGWREGLLGRATVGVGLDSQAGYTLKSNEPVIVEDLRREPRFSGPPLLHEHGVVSGMSVIIHGVDGRPYGVLGTHTANRRVFTRDDVHFLQSVANVLGAAVQRRQIEAELATRVREAEAARQEAETARQEAEAAARRVAFLAEASARLAGSLDVEATLRAIAELAVPALADWCFVEVLDRGRIRPAAVAHPDSAMVQLAHEVLERYPVDLDAPFGTGKVLRTGEPELVPEIPDAVLAAVAQDAEHLAILRRLGLRSSLSVPLVDTAGHPIAVLSLVSATSGRRYGAADLAVAEEVARRGAAALASARLYAAGQAALRRATALQQVSSALAGALTAAEVARVIVHHGRAAVGADAGAVVTLDGDTGMFESLASEGYDEATTRLFARFPLSPGRPLSEAVLRNAPTYLPSLQDAEERFAEISLALRATGYQAYVALPLGGAPQPTAGLSLSFAEPQRFHLEERAFLETLAAQAGQALERARLIEAERAARAEAEAASRAKTEFLAVMSHELRTPLNAIGGYAELIEVGLRGPVSEAQRDDLMRIRRSQRHLLHLMNDVLDFARLGTGALQFQPTVVPLPEVLSDLEALVEGEVAAKSLAWDRSACPADLTVHADRERLLQILTNLVTNSVKFTPAGGGVTVECAGDGATVRVRVTDTGIGIPPEQLERVFQPFTQVHGGLRRTVGGTGLGLAISRGLAEAMGGTLTAESSPGHGTTLSLVLPRTAPEDSA